MTKIVEHRTNFYLSFNKVYAINQSDINSAVAYTLLNTNINSSLNYLFSNPAEFVSSIRKYPIDFKALIPTEEQANFFIPVKVGNVNFLTENQGRLDGYSIGDLQWYFPHVFLEKCKLATIQISRKFNNFLDYNPYTKIEIDIPFTSPVELNPVDVYDKTIEVYCIPDFNTGKGTIYIQNDDRILYITQATISVDIPLGTTNAVENLRNQVNNLFNLGSGVAQGIIGASSGNPFGVAQGLGLVSSALVNGVNNNIIHYTSKGTGNGVGNMFSPLKVYSVIRTPKVKTITQYNHLYGKPLMSYERLDQTHGYTEVEEIHLEYIDKALQTEIDEIRTLLKEGVILP